MLLDNKNIYKKSADMIPNWKLMSKSDLIRSYIKVKGDKNLENSYISAIILKYWNSLNKYYYGQARSGRVYIEDCYDWLTQALIYTTNKHIWDQPIITHTYAGTNKTKSKPNPLYGNPDGPNIAMCACINSMRLGFYQASNYDKRKVNYTTASVDKIIEEGKEIILPKEESNDLSMPDNLVVKQLIEKAFNSKNYYKAFVLDGIVNGDVFEIPKNENKQIFNKKKLAKHLRYLNDDYCKTISTMFNLNSNEIIEASNIYKKLNSTKMYRVIDAVLDSLKPTIEKELIC